MKLIAKAALLGAVPVLGAAVASYAEPTITKAPAGKIQSNIKVSQKAVKVIDKKSPRDLKVISSEKVIIKADLPSVLKPVPSFRIKYPPNNIWVRRGTRIIVRGTAKNANGLLLDARYDGIRYVENKIPGTNTYIPDKTGKPFSNEQMYSYMSFSPEYVDGQNQWAFDSVLTNNNGRNPGPWRSRIVPTKVHITVYSLAPLTNGEIKPDTPRTQTITVDIRD